MKWHIHTPEGVQDILIEECRVKRSLEARIRELFLSHGFYEVETPTYEFYDVFSPDDDRDEEVPMFKFFDREGRVLVLRPDLTVPVARITATRLQGRTLPLRICYIGNVFRYNEYGGGKQNEFTQAGAEILGADTPEADAEVIALAIKSLLAMGLENFQVDIGQVEFFKGIMEEAELEEDSVREIRVLVEKKDFVGMREYVEKLRMDGRYKELILSLPGLFGSLDVIEKAKKLTSNRRSLKALDSLTKVLEILKDYEFSRYVSLDLGMFKGLYYDTGIVFRGFAYGVGFPILSGGRYDRLTGRFGRECPATGFSIGINMVMAALERQKAEIETPAIDTVVCYREKSRKMAISLAESLRRQGLKVELDVTGKPVEWVKSYAASNGIKGIVAVLDDERIELHNLESGTVEGTTVSRLLGKG